jgi:hypothetical protein
MARSDGRFVAFMVTDPGRVKLNEIRGWADGKSTSAILRALILVAKPEHLPQSWRNIPDDERELVKLAEVRE